MKSNKTFKKLWPKPWHCFRDIWLLCHSNWHYRPLQVTVIRTAITHVSKNLPPLVCYNFDTRDTHYPTAVTTTTTSTVTATATAAASAPPLPSQPPPLPLPPASPPPLLSSPLPLLPPHHYHHHRHCRPHYHHYRHRHRHRHHHLHPTTTTTTICFNRCFPGKPGETFLSIFFFHLFHNRTLGRSSKAVFSRKYDLPVSVKAPVQLNNRQQLPPINTADSKV